MSSPEQYVEWAANEAVERAYARLALARALSERHPEEHDVLAVPEYELRVGAPALRLGG